MRPEIRVLVELGRLPSEDDAEVDVLKKFDTAYRKIEPPVTDEEAIALVELFGDDGCFGLASSLMNLVETAPGCQLKMFLPPPTTHGFLS